MSSGEPALVSHPLSAVITVSYGSSEVLKVFLQTLRKFHGIEQVVVVVDNKPDEDNVRDLAESFDAIYVPLEANPGYGAGMNAGVQAVEGKYDAYFFCNPDVSFLEPSIGPLTTSLLRDPRTGSIGPRVLNSDGSVYPSARRIPSLSTGVGHALFSKIWPSNPWTSAYVSAAEYSARRETGALSGAAVMVNRLAFERIGGWDESYFMHFEDIDLGYRLGLNGYRNIFEPSVSLHHSGAHSTRKHAAIVEQAMTDSAIRFMRKRYSGIWNSPTRLVITLGLRGRGALRLRALSRSV